MSRRSRRRRWCLPLKSRSIENYYYCVTVCLKNASFLFRFLILIKLDDILEQKQTKHGKKISSIANGTLIAFLKNKNILMKKIDE